MLLPRTLKASSVIGFLPLGISFTAFKCVFMAMSTPARGTIGQITRSWERQRMVGSSFAPVIVPWITLPFLSSICTVSFASFIKNLHARKVA